MSSFLSSVFGCGEVARAPNRPPPIRSLKHSFGSPAPPRGLTPVGPYPHSRKPSMPAAAALSVSGGYNDIPVYPYLCPNSNRYPPQPQRQSEALSNIWSGAPNDFSDRPDWVTFPAQFPSARDRFGLLNPQRSYRPPAAETESSKICMASFGTQTTTATSEESTAPPSEDQRPVETMQQPMVPRTVEVALQVECKPRQRRELTVTRKALVDVETVSTSGDAEIEVAPKSEKAPSTESSWPSSPPRPIDIQEKEALKKTRRQLVHLAVDTMEPFHLQPARLVMHTLSEVRPLDPQSPPMRLSTLSVDLSSGTDQSTKFTTDDVRRLVERVPDPASFPPPISSRDSEFQALAETPLLDSCTLLCHSSNGGQTAEDAWHCVCQKCPARAPTLKTVHLSLSPVRKHQLSPLQTDQVPRQLSPSQRQTAAVPPLILPFIGKEASPPVLQAAADKSAGRSRRPRSSPERRAGTGGVGKMIAQWEERCSPSKSARSGTERVTIPPMQLVKRGETAADAQTASLSDSSNQVATTAAETTSSLVD